MTEMLSDESLLDWAVAWLPENPADDPTYRQRFRDGLAVELKVRAERADAVLAYVAGNSPDRGRRLEDDGKRPAREAQGDG